MSRKKVIIVGAGPSGLVAGLEIVRAGDEAIVFEKSQEIGGLARTIEYKNNRFDIGPHRFFTFNKEVNHLFQEMCGADLVYVPRLTRIFYKKKFFNYPLTPFNALFGVGIFNSISIFISYMKATWCRSFVPKQILTFEDWVVDRFGRRLFQTFFKTYTEKVWGIPCDRIGADWAGQRIKGLSLLSAVKNALLKPKNADIKTLADEFMYPRLGAGQIYENMANYIDQHGGFVHLETSVKKINRENFSVKSVSVQDKNGSIKEVSGEYFLSSAPLTQILEQFSPMPPDKVLNAARALRYRNHISVQLVLKQSSEPFPDNWIYVHSADVKMVRVCSYKNFSKDMCASDDQYPITVEYFCFEGDEIWSATDDALIQLAKHELEKMEITKIQNFIDGFVVRSARAYPVIEVGFQEKIDIIKAWLDNFTNFLPIGRSGMFKYNNQDHAMATGMLAARTALGQGPFDPWLVNIDGMYHEGVKQNIEEAA